MVKWKPAHNELIATHVVRGYLVGTLLRISQCTHIAVKLTLGIICFMTLCVHCQPHHSLDVGISATRYASGHVCRQHSTVVLYRLQDIASHGNRPVGDRLFPRWVISVDKSIVRCAPFPNSTIPDFAHE